VIRKKRKKNALKISRGKVTIPSRGLKKKVPQGGKETGRILHSKGGRKALTPEGRHNARHFRELRGEKGKTREGKVPRKTQASYLTGRRNLSVVNWTY